MAGSSAATLARRGAGLARGRRGGAEPSDTATKKGSRAWATVAAARVATGTPARGAFTASQRYAPSPGPWKTGPTRAVKYPPARKCSCIGVAPSTRPSGSPQTPVFSGRQPVINDVREAPASG